MGIRVGFSFKESWVIRVCFEVCESGYDRLGCEGVIDRVFDLELSRSLLCFVCNYSREVLWVGELG